MLCKTNIIKRIKVSLIQFFVPYASHFIGISWMEFEYIFRLDRTVGFDVQVSVLSFSKSLSQIILTSLCAWEEL